MSKQPAATARPMRVEWRGFRRSGSKICGTSRRRSKSALCRTTSASKVCRRESSSRDRKSTRLNSSHVEISYAVFCLKKKKKQKTQPHALKKKKKQKTQK